MTSATQVLRDILLEGTARTQLEIQHALERQGISSSQSKISRLLHQIGAVKLVDNQGKTQYRLPHEVGLIHELTSPQEKVLIRQWVLSVVANETTIIIHTTPGAAGMVARIIDQHRIDLNILGTIAGDDTIFVAPKHNGKMTETIHLITRLFDF
ncbi:MAG: ArgR family transcriptional regulator [Legionella sp.]|nr:MAG: ArgR family transcriptional regulator [Legionella sp.]